MKTTGTKPVSQLMKAVLCAFLAGVLALPSVSGLAMGLLPSFEEEFMIQMPDLTAVTGKPAEQSKTEQDGSSSLSYSDILPEDYEAFSRILSAAGCRLEDSAVEGSVLTAHIVKETGSLTVGYDFTYGTMTLTYSADVFINPSFTEQAEEGILPPLDQLWSNALPDLSNLMKRAADSIKTADGMTEETWNGFRDGNYDALGDYLEHSGCVLTDYSVSGKTVTFRLEKNGQSFSVSYDRANGILRMSRAADTAVEKGITPAPTLVPTPVPVTPTQKYAVEVPVRYVCDGVVLIDGTWECMAGETTEVFAMESLYGEDYLLSGSHSVSVNVSLNGIATPGEVVFTLISKPTATPKKTATPRKTATPGKTSNKKLSKTELTFVNHKTIKKLISSCPCITKHTKDTKDFFSPASYYRRTFPVQDNQIHTWMISIQGDVIFFCDEFTTTYMTIKTKGSAAELTPYLRWEVELLESLPSIINSAKEYGIKLIAEKKVSGGDYAQYADSNGVIDLMNQSKYNSVLEMEHTNLGFMELINAMSGLGALDTNGNGKIDTEEIFK